MKNLIIIFALCYVMHVIYVYGSLPPIPPPTTEKPTTVKPTPQSNCGYQSCHPIKDGDFINVHLVPHTHDDVGWLKTVDQYYYGSKTNIQNAGVQYILDSVVDSLRKDQNRRFIYVETAFFWKWWMKQHDTVKSLFRRYVNNGQLEFISGGWSMNDEAVTHYQSIVDQMTWGLRKLNDSFGECGRPKMGWQIDPFGHSREMASIFAQLGFDGLLLGRIDYQEKDYRLKTKTAEGVWRASQNLGEKSEIFTGVMYNTYSPPRGFCFDILCSDEPMIDDKKSADYNVNKRVDDMIEFLNNMTVTYDSKNLIVTMGEDFNYQNAESWFKNLDKLIYYTNARQNNGSRYNLIYSTPSCYIKAIYDQNKGKKWPVKQDDFFPYASDPHSFWTGYFTSRPTIKKFEREGNNFLQVCKQLYVLADLDPVDRVDLNALREAMGVMQHHDAITGTEKEHVAHDYARILSNGIKECELITGIALSKIIAPNTKTFVDGEPAPSISFTHCPLLNVSQCAFTEKRSNFIVTIYNPLSRSISKFVRLPVLGKAYDVVDPDGKKLDTQMIPIPEAILNIPGRDSIAQNELIFQAIDIPPLGFKSYYVKKLTGNEIPKVETLRNYKLGEAEFQIDTKTGLINKITINEKTIDLNQEFLYYNGYVGDNKKFTNRSSGAYIFRPLGDSFKVTNKADLKVFRGPLVSEIHQKFNDWISQVIKVYGGESFVEFNWIVGPIPIDHTHGKEIITRYKTTLQSNSTFYTDSNGRETLTRIRNFRPTWNLKLNEQVAGNYYPVTTKIAIRDETRGLEMAVLTDRAEGGSSLRDGEIELMLHRRCLHDDAFGVGEALNETAFGKGLVATGSHYVILGSTNNKNPGGKTVAAQERDLIQQKLLAAWTFLSDADDITFEQYRTKYKTSHSGLIRNLPDNVQILTLEPWKGDSFLLRLEHVLELNEDPVLSKPVTVDLKNLFAPFEITNLRETTLGANQWLSDSHRLNFDTNSKLEELWKAENYYQKWAKTQWGRTMSKHELNLEGNENTDDLKIVLTPMQIRTFIFNIVTK